MRKDTSMMIGDRGLWAGLNFPNISIDEADIVVFGIAYDGAVSFRSGASEAPSALRQYTYTITPTTEDFESFEHIKIRDLGDFSGEDQVQLFKEVKAQVSELARKNKFFTMIGGDHSVSIPVYQGLNEGLEGDFGIIHIDAHFDLCNQMEGNEYSYGCPARRASELDKVGLDNICFLGIRSIEMDEWDFIKNNPINLLSAREIHQIGIKKTVELVRAKLSHLDNIYITVDIDGLDPAYAPGTGTPQFGGLTSRELLELLRGLFELPIIGFDVVEIAPSLDDALTSVFAGRKIITESWGHHLRTLDKLHPLR